MTFISLYSHELLLIVLSVATLFYLICAHKTLPGLLGISSLLSAVSAGLIILQLYLSINDQANRPWVWTGAAIVFLLAGILQFVSIVKLAPKKPSHDSAYKKIMATEKRQ